MCIISVEFHFLERLEGEKGGMENKQTKSFQLRNKEQRTKTANIGKEEGQTDNPSVLGFGDFLPCAWVWAWPCTVPTLCPHEQLTSQVQVANDERQPSTTMYIHTYNRHDSILHIDTAQ